MKSLLNNLPQGFWYLAGTALCIFSLGSTYTLGKAGIVTVETDKAKFNLSNQIDKAQQINEDLKLIAAELDEQKKINEIINQKLEKAAARDLEIQKLKDELEAIRFVKNDKNVEAVERQIADSEQELNQLKKEIN